MRLDPIDIGSLLRSQAASDAASGQRTSRQAREAEKESQFEPIDSILLRRLRATLVADAADTLKSLDEAKRAVAKVHRQIASDPARAQAAHDALARERLRDLLGDD